MDGMEISGINLPTQVQTDTLTVPVFVFELPWEKPPLTENQRLHWRKKSALVKAIRSHVHWMTVRVPHFDRIRVDLEWVVTTRHRRDADNIVPTLKAICDGLVDAGIVDDDTPDFMDKQMPTLTYELGGRPRLVLTITPLPKEASA